MAVMARRCISMSCLSNICGQVVTRRTLGKKLVFFDIVFDQPMELPDEGGGHGQTLRHSLELIAKLGVFSRDAADFKALRDAVGLGDHVSASGELDGGGSLQLTGIKVVHSWRQDNPGREFAPGKQHVALLMASTGSKQRHGGAGGGEQEGRGELQGRLGSGAQDVVMMQAIGTGYVAAEAGGKQQQGLDLAPDPGQPQAPRSVGHCKFFVNTGRCHRGELCPFLHCPPEVLKQQRKEWLKERNVTRRQRASGLGFSTHEGASSAEKSRRAVVVAEWLVKTFGREALSAGTGVLDVAGGHGALTFELQAVHGVPCTLIEPRPFTLSKGQRRYLELQQRSKQQQQQLQGPGVGADSDGGINGHAAAEGAAASLDQDPDIDPDQGMFDGACLDMFLQQRSPAEHEAVESPDGSGSGSRSLVEHEAAGSPGGPKAGFMDPLKRTMTPILPNGGDAASIAAAACEGTSSSSSLLLTVREAGFLQLQSCFTPDLWGAGRGSSSAVTEPSLDSARTAASDLADITSLLPNGTSGRAVPAGSTGGTEGKSNGGGGSAPLSEAVRLHLSSCSLVVGLHPDQATDGILEFALAHGKPFAIVPCCVFPTLFTQRRLRGGGGGGGELPASSLAAANDGDSAAGLRDRPVGSDLSAADSGGGVPVVSHGQLVAYLAERGGPGSRVVHLPLMGANTVVYRREA